MKMVKFPTINSYIESFPFGVRPILEKLRETIHKAAPEATETMSYGMPTFVYKKKNLVHFACWSTHIGFYPTPSGIDELPELEEYRRGKGTIQFLIEKPIPFDLVTKVTKFRMGEIEKKS